MGTICIRGGKIWNGQRFIENNLSTYNVCGEGKTFYLPENDLILPGLIDFHTHLAHPALRTSHFGVEPQEYYKDGIVGALEAGTAGLNTWKPASRYWKDMQGICIRPYLTLFPTGVGLPFGEVPKFPDSKALIAVQELLEAPEGGDICGIKVLLGYTSLDADRFLLREARRLADASGKRLLVHIKNSFVTFEELAEYLAPGDVAAHIYAGNRNSIWDDNKSLANGVLEAKERGVLFDVAFGGEHFSWEVLKKAHAAGVAFDFLGSDLITRTRVSGDGLPHSLFRILSGFLAAGIDADEVFRTVTTNASSYLHIPLPIPQRCLILHQIPSEVSLLDGRGQSLSLHCEYVPVFFLDNGVTCKDETNLLYNKA